MLKYYHLKLRYIERNSDNELYMLAFVIFVVRVSPKKFLRLVLLFYCTFTNILQCHLTKYMSLNTAAYT